MWPQAVSCDHVACLALLSDYFIIFMSYSHVTIDCLAESNRICMFVCSVSLLYVEIN